MQLQILTAAVKLFILNPKKNQKMITQLLKNATEEAASPDVRDRGAWIAAVICLFIYLFIDLFSLFYHLSIYACIIYF